MKKKIFGLITTIVMAVSLVGVLPVSADEYVNYKPTLATNGQWVDGHIGYSDEENEFDYHPIYISTAGKLTITMLSLGNLRFEILDSDYNYIDSYSSYNASDSNPENMTFCAWLEKGTYYVMVTEYYSSEYSGDYRIKASFTSANSNEIEPNDTYLQAQPVENGSTITGIFAKGKYYYGEYEYNYDKYDFYKITLTERTKYSFYLTSYDSHSRSVSIDFTLYDNNLYEINRSVDYDYHSDNTIRYICTLNAGTYYVRLSGYVNCKYILKFNTAAPVSSSSTTTQSSNLANSLKNNNSSNSNINTSSMRIVKPAKVTNVKIKTGNQTAKITWKKVSGSTGYQVKYSTGKKFKKAKTKTKITNKRTIKLKNLTKKKYFVKVRAYKTVNSKKVYGTWSKVLKLYRV